MTASDMDFWSGVIGAFSQAKAAIEATFGVGSAPEMVACVLRGDKPRKGVCLNGFEYFVHGVGYTVVVPPEGQVHIDGSSEGDFFTAYDMAFFLDSAELCESPEVADVRSSCDMLCDRGLLVRVGDGRYSLVS